MEFIKMKIEDLKVTDYNPRVPIQENKKEYDLLFKSIKEFGYVEPIIYNKTTQNIIGGNQRLQILKDLGYKNVNCVIVKMEEKKEKLLNIALNKLKGSWDEVKLKDLINGMNTEMQTLTGFSDKEIEKLLGETTLGLPDDEEINVDDFIDENFDYKCPECGFQFNKKG